MHFKWNWSGKKTLFMMTVPCFILLAVFAYLPLAGWIMAFYEYKPGLPIFKTDFVGLIYFKLAIYEPDLIPVLRNTIALSLLGILFSPLPVLFAVFLSEMRSLSAEMPLPLSRTCKSTSVPSHVPVRRNRLSGG